jgi:hypothetical protein
MAKAIRSAPKRLKTLTDNEPMLNKILLTLKSITGRRNIIAKNPKRKSKADSQNKAITKKTNNLLNKGREENNTIKVAGKQIKDENKAIL